jgi:protein TonB
MFNLKMNVMVAKKSEQTNLENKRFLFFEIGMVLALSAALVAIEWKSAKPQTIYMAYNGDEFFPEDMTAEITRPELKKEIKPPELPEIHIIKDEAKIEDDPFLDFNVDANEGDIIEFIPFEPKEEKPDSFVFVYFAEKMPRYHNGGLDNFRKHIQEIVEYPPTAVEMGLSGKVFVKFVVDKKGYVTGIEIQRGIHPLLDNAVIAAIKKSDRWQPGMQGKFPVNVAMSMPVVFRLQ